MKNNYTDVEILIEFMSLVSKYGRKKVENVIEILKDKQATDQIIKLFDDSIGIFETNKAILKNGDSKSFTEEEILTDRIINLLKNGFTSNRHIDEVLSKYSGKLTLLKKRDEKLVGFKVYLDTLSKQELSAIFNEVREFSVQKSDKLEKVSDLSKWSNIITKKDDEKALEMKKVREDEEN